MLFKDVFVPAPAVGDPRWKSQNPIRILWGIIATSAIGLVIQGYYINLVTPFLCWFILVSALDLILFFKKHLRPTYAVSIASIWIVFALFCIGWASYRMSFFAPCLWYDHTSRGYSDIVQLIVTVVVL
ncbi:hypothetical protein BZA05DRAFT_441602 [Tricharina praecox]|uniref:uncharacterized protein n=1 Tax=Tricharina praecox TaxID=43433 RepID=UPI00221E5F48|nr:uncharacterized protein BZA05DRAFT_441602 [Tricharina praecox]KAI5856967.1 hypothetical protein BZA05DRAFT_441602 [Tricharina praecox]